MAKQFRNFFLVLFFLFARRVTVTAAKDHFEGKMVIQTRHAAGRIVSFENEVNKKLK